MTETDAGAMAVEALRQAVGRLETDVKHQKIDIKYLRADIQELLRRVGDIEQLKAATPKEQFQAFRALEQSS